MGGGRFAKSISISVCGSVSVSLRQSGAVFSLWVGEVAVASRLVGFGLGELVLGVVESGLFSLKREDSGECLFVVSSMILLCILGVIVGFGLGCPRGVSPLGLGFGWLWASLVL